MKLSRILIISISLLFLIGCQTEPPEAQEETPPPVDGVFVHLTHGPEDPHRVLMGLQMAVMMSDSLDVAVYCDIQAVRIVLADAEDMSFEHFPSSHTQIKTLLERGVPVMACPGCLKAINKTAEDLMPGVTTASREKFFGFTDGRILTLDY
jgi:predicted peroxiredoxin